MLKSGETTSSGSIHVLQVSDNFSFSVVEAFVGPVAALLNTKAQTSGTQYGKPWSILVNFITSTRTCSFEKGFLLEGHMNAYDQSIPKLCSSNSGNSPLGAPALLCQVGGPHTHTHTPCGDTMQCKLQRRWVWIRFAADIIHLRYPLTFKMAPEPQNGLKKGRFLFHFFGSMLLCTWEIILKDPVKRILLATLPFWINVASACSLYSDKSW